MKVNELQIGDYVNYRGQIIKVTSLYDKGGSNEVGWSDKESVWVNAISAEPIPLTPEILEKNGFERSKVFVEWKYKNDIVYMIYKPFPYLKIQMEECLVVFPCEHVHQLQHALRLCGIDKTIEL